MDDLIGFGTLTKPVADFLGACIRGRLDMLITGGTGTGKTTTLNVLSQFLPADERIVTIEDAAELQLHQEHVLRLESRPPNIEGRGQVTVRDLVRNSLRMRPDRIVIGEVRDGAALDMLQAMNTGHDGSMTTVHANSPRDSLARIETMVLMAGIDLPVRAIREQTAAAIDLIIHQTRLKDGSRRITHITEVVGLEGDVIALQDLFLFDFRAGPRRVSAGTVAPCSPPVCGRCSSSGWPTRASPYRWRCSLRRRPRPAPTGACTATRSLRPPVRRTKRRRSPARAHRPSPGRSAVRPGRPRPQARPAHHRTGSGRRPRTRVRPEPRPPRCTVERAALPGTGRRGGAAGVVRRSGQPGRARTRCAPTPGPDGVTREIGSSGGDPAASRHAGRHPARAGRRRPPPRQRRAWRSASPRWLRAASRSC